jgi:hypothetical protein
MHNLVTRV